MPTKRMITPAFWQSESIARLTPLQRLLFIGLFSNADDQGRLRGHPALIRSLIFPYDDITNEQIESDLKAIEAIGAIVIYEKDEKHCIQVTGWWKYQSPQWAYPSDLPPCDGWCDQLRYRQNNRVITQNWKGEDDIINEEPLGKALPKDKGKALVSSPIELDIELGLDSESTPNGVGDKSPVPPPDKKPKAQSEPKPDGPLKQLMGTFQTETGLKMPHKKSDIKFWWSNIGEIYEIANRDVDVGQRLIKQSSQALKDKTLTIGGPESIIKTCRALAAGQNISGGSYEPNPTKNGQNGATRQTGQGGHGTDEPGRAQRIGAAFAAKSRGNRPPP